MWPFRGWRSRKPSRRGGQGDSLSDRPHRVENEPVESHAAENRLAESDPTESSIVTRSSTETNDGEGPCLVVGLGNPGKKYEGTRHNVGYDVLARLANRYGEGRPKARFEGETLEGMLGGRKVILLTPTTYMNLSGRSVRAARDFYKLPLQSILIVCDDLSLPLGKLRIRGKGSAGGQKGLQNILQQLGSQEVPRLRLGIGAAPPQWDVADYVLSKFSKDDKVVMDEAYHRAVEAIVCWANSGITDCMNQFNADKAV